MSNKIYFNEPYITGNEQQFIEDVFRRKKFYGNGYYTEQCQNKISEILSVENVLLTDSCTSALEMSALLLREWDKEQEIILPSYTFSSTASAFARAGFKIVFAEINPRTMMVDINDVEKKITNKTIAVVIVHYGGWGAETKKFREMCDNKNLLLIEDAAQAFGCKDEGKSLGSFGDLACFSFHETKNLHAGLSGALVINNPIFITRAAHIWERGTNRQEVLKGIVDKYSWVEIGGSFYPTELQAAFLFAQLEFYEENSKQRKEIFDGYYEVFINTDVDDFYFPQVYSSFESNYHAFWIMFNSIEECDFVREKLQGTGISAYIGYVPLHSSKVGVALGNKPEDLPLTEEFSSRLLRMPLHNNMTALESRGVAIKTIEFIGEFRE